MLNSTSEMWGWFFSPSNSNVHGLWLCWRRFHCGIQYEEFFLCGSGSSSEWSRHSPHLQSTHTQRERISQFITKQWTFNHVYSHLILSRTLTFTVKAKQSPEILGNVDKSYLKKSKINKKTWGGNESKGRDFFRGFHFTRFRSRGASTSSLHLLSILWMDPSSLFSSLITSLSTNMGIRWQVGNLLSYAWGRDKKKSWWKPTRFSALKKIGTVYVYEWVTEGHMLWRKTY